MKVTSLFIRLVSSIVLLGIVWKYSHWSVALCLTLIFIAEEVRHMDQWKKIKWH